MLTAAEVHWVAGLLEGEGSFGFYGGELGRGGSPRIFFGTSDLDVLERFKRLAGTAKGTHRRKANALSRKSHYQVSLDGRRAAGWMMTIYPLMGSRRKGQIRKALEGWRARPAQPGRTVRQWATGY